MYLLNILYAIHCITDVSITLLTAMFLKLKPFHNSCIS
jgi:hypothetical protein